MKRRMALWLALSILAGTLLTACGDSTPSDTEDTTPGTTAADTTTVAETTAPPEYVAPDVDYDGAEFIFSSWKTDKPNWIMTGYHETSAGELDGDVINESLYYRNLHVEEDLGVKIVPHGYSSSNEMIAPTLAGDEYAHCVLSEPGSFNSIVNQHLIYDLAAIDSLDLSKSWWEKDANESMSIAGRQYAATGGISPFTYVAVFTTFFNKNMINDLKLDNPYELVYDGKWTMDKMVEYATAAAKDVNGDGTMDKGDIFGMNSETALGTVTLRATGERITTKDKNDIPVISLNTERTIEAVEKYVKMYRNKSINMYSSEFSAGYGNVFRELFVNKFMADELLFLNNWMVVALELRNMDSDFGVLPPAKLDEDQDKYYVASSDSWVYFSVMPITVKDPTFAGYVMESLGYYGMDVRDAIIEKTIETKTSRDKETGEMMDLIFSNRVFDIATLFNWGGINSMLNTFISQESTDFSSAYATAEATAKAALKETVDGILKNS